MNSYLANSHPPLHLRRTLDQYYYHTLSNTDKRDKDQVVTRYQTNNRLQPGVITMVDQLWLWVLEGVDEQPDTIISCFPEVGNTDPAKAGVVRDLDPESRTNVLERVKHHLLAEPYSIETAYDLAGLIAATCSRTYLDPGSTLTVANGRDKWGLQFSELYQTEISDIVRPPCHQCTNTNNPRLRKKLTASKNSHSSKKTKSPTSKRKSTSSRESKISSTSST
jgi:hypothetical protein